MRRKERREETEFRSLKKKIHVVYHDLLLSNRDNIFLERKMLERNKLESLKPRNLFDTYWFAKEFLQIQLQFGYCDHLN